VHVVVVGCGRVGSGLAAHLVARDHTVAIIDRVEAAFRRLPEDFSGQRVIGVGFDRDVLGRAGVERADALAAVTNGDNSNIVIARVAHESFGIERVVARIYDPNRAQIYERLGIPTVATSQWTIEQVLRRVMPAGRSIEWNDPAGQVSVVEETISAEVAGTTLAQLDLSEIALPVALTRLGKTRLVRPDLVLQEGDILYLAVDNEHLDKLDVHFAASAEASH
jgi:trk system potassium uptake protein TrkA